MDKIAGFLDIVCLVVLAGWAYLVAKRKCRDEVGWAMIAAAAYYVVGMAMQDIVFPAVRARAGWSEGWQKPSGFIAGILAGVIANLVLTFRKPLAPGEAGKGGQPPAPGAGPASGDSGGGPAAPSGQGPVRQAVTAAAPPSAAAPAFGPWTFVVRWWPAIIIVLMYLVTQFDVVIDMLRNRGYEPPYPPWREVTLPFLIGAQVWLVRRSWVDTLVAVLFVAAYIPTINWMEWRWGRGSDYYSHGYIIPLVVGGLIWRVRKQLASLEARDDLRFIGLAVLGGGLSILLTGAFLRAYSIQGLSLVIVLCGLVFFLCGRAISKLLLFPLLFTITMVPLPMHTIDGLSFRLKMFASKASVWVVDALRAVGVHSYVVVQDGSYIRWLKGNGELDEIIIGDVCSGLRSLIALIAFGALFAYVAKLSLTRKMLLFVASVPCSLLANMWRIVTLTFIASHWGSDATHGWVHDWTGYGIFAVAFILFFGFERLLHGFGAARGGEPAAAT